VTADGLCPENSARHGTGSSPMASSRTWSAGRLMPALHRQGQITLPPAGKTAVKPGCNRRKPVLVQVDQTPLFSALKDITRHPIYYLETFVDQERFKGTCYFAANWLYLGQTTGRGKNDQTGRANLSLKAVLGYPLTSDFRKKLCEVPW